MSICVGFSALPTLLYCKHSKPAFLDAGLGPLSTEPFSMQSDTDIGLPSEASPSAATFAAPQHSKSQSALDALSGPTATKGVKGDRVREHEPSPRPGKKQRLNPQPMTAAAAMLETQRESREKTPLNQTTPNPAREALSALLGVSKPVTGPLSGSTSDVQNGTSAATTVSDPLAVVVENIQQNPDTMLVDSTAQTSPVSVSTIGSLGTVDSTTVPTLLATNPIVSPSPLGSIQDEGDGRSNAESTSPDDGNKAFSYPGPLLQPHLADNRRGMSLPHSGLRHESPRSPSNKKHRCPYCATEFTRHHNLKSHLLTHSQEKPYVCSTCQSRFRRLHDLKRHTKLHTGERPHICEKCGRKFARGDALARHNKGPGGCAGRRASMDDFGGDDDYDGNDDSMEGLVYGEPETLDDDEGIDKRPRMPRVPSIKRHDAPAGSPPPPSSGQNSYSSRQPSTYPPIQGRPAGGIASGTFPPRGSAGGPVSSNMMISQGAAAAYTSTSSSLQPPGQGTAVFPQSAMTESPKPLSPGSAPTRQASHHDGGIYRNRSSSVAAQFQQQHFGRGSTQQNPPGGSMSMPPTAPQLPLPPGLNPPDSRFTLPSQGGPTHPPTQPSGPPTHMSGSGPLSSHSNSHSSHGHSAQGSSENAAAIFVPNNNDRLWAYVKSLEQRINGLQDEVSSLKGQLAAATQPQSRQA